MNKLATMTLLGLLASACTQTDQSSARSGPHSKDPHRTQKHFKSGRIEVTVPAYTYVNGLPRPTGGTETRTLEVAYPSRTSQAEPARPHSLPKGIPWRPKRYFGPFTKGTGDLGQIQIHLNGRSATWHYNGYFASIDPAVDPDELDIHRIYYRRDFLADPPASASLPGFDATAPTSQSPALGQRAAQVQPQESSGFATDVLLALQEITFSNRYGGSVCYLFKLATVPTPTRGQVEPEDFGYEFGQNGANRSPNWRFDTNDLIMRLYIVPLPSLINPKDNKDYSKPEIAVEFDPGNFVAYKDGMAMSQEAGAPVLKDVLAVLAPAVGSSLMTNGAGDRRPDISLYTHSYIHDQHKLLIDTNEKVTLLLISDTWCDVVTENYQPVIIAKLRIVGITDERGLGWSDFEGEPEWWLRAKTYIVQGDESRFLRQHTWELKGNVSSTSTVIVAFSRQECAASPQLEVNLKLKDINPLEDEVFYVASLPLILDCEGIERVIDSNSWPMRIVGHGILPVNTVGVPECNGVEDQVQLGPSILSPTTVCYKDGVLRGTTRIHMYDVLGPIGAEVTWESHVSILAR